jgi:uncharacterized protein (TIGR00251 family)
MKLKIKVIPSSSKDCIAGYLEDTLKVKVKAPPEKGKANKAVIKVLEKSLDLPKGSINISSGTTSSRKIIEIKCSDDDVINKKLGHIFHS